LLEVAARENKLPAAVAADRDELAVAHGALQGELGRRVAAEGEPAPVVRAADRIEDNAFGALSDWLLSFKRLPAEKHPEATDAQMVYDVLFAQGLGFLTLRAPDEWQEAETRVRLIAEKGLGAIIEKLGGKPFLDELEAAHAGYGEALGITKARPSPETPSVGEARDVAHEVLRSYVLRVAAHARRSAPKTGALADRLLAPLARWKDRPVKMATSPAPVTDG
jgi:hypothetical protein